MAKRRNRKSTSSANQTRVLTSDGWESPIVILFTDIVGCSEISNHETLKAYNKIVKDFQNLFLKVTKEHEKKFYKDRDHIYFKPLARGDEGSLMIFRKIPIPQRFDDWADDIDSAITIALDLKRRWLLSDYNKERIRAGQITSDIAIGIHFGKAWINRTTDGYQPEGYAINLAKRIESQSREGPFTHIDIGEAAHDYLYLLTDEQTYSFAPPRFIKPIGISQGINVFEIKHHFLPTDWTSEVTDASKWKTFEPSEDDIATITDACIANPTNLWLAEEFIMLKMQFEHNRLKVLGKEEDEQSIKDAYKDVEEKARKIATGPFRDAVSVCILGLILGEYGAYNKEQQYYEDAIEEDKLYAEAYWYAAYSISREIFEKYGEQGPLGKKLDEISKEDQKRIDKVLRYYEKAAELKPWQGWMKYDYACELWRWGKKQEAISNLEKAFSLDYRLIDNVAGEPYLEGIEKEPRVKKLLHLYVNEGKEIS